MKYTRKVATLILAIGLIFSMNFSVFADTSDQGLVTVNSPAIQITVDDNGNVSFDEGKNESTEFIEQSLERSTVTGNIGSASITWINKGQINWRLTSYLPRQFIIFTGGIDIVGINSNYYKYISIAKSGSSPLSDNAFVSLPAGVYMCTLSGFGTCDNIKFTVETVHDTM